MSKSIYRTGIIICAVAILGFALFLAIEPSYAAFGLEQAAKGTGLSTTRKLPDFIGSLIKAALSFVGVLFLLLMLYAGFLWMTARGNTETVTKAKDLIVGAVIGIVIVVSAYAITSFVIGGLTGTGTTTDTSCVTKSCTDILCDNVSTQELCSCGATTDFTPVPKGTCGK